MCVSPENYRKVQGLVVQRVDNFIQRTKFARPIKFKNAPILSAGKGFIRWIKLSIFLQPGQSVKTGTLIQLEKTLVCNKAIFFIRSRDYKFQRVLVRI